MTLNHDLHVHTYLSDCCSDKANQRPDKILALAEAMGVATIGFSDHIWVNPKIAPSGWYRAQDETQTTRLRADLASVSTTLAVLVGCEADMCAPGMIGMTRSYAETLDFVLLSCSHFHMRDFVVQPRSNSPRDVAAHLLAFFRSGVASGLATSIAHPFLPCGFIEQYDAIIAAITDAEFADAFGLAAAHGVAIEATTAFLPPRKPAEPAWSLETPVRMLSLARQAGCKFTFGTDAHCPEHQRLLPDLQQLIDAAGITDTDVLSLDVVSAC